MIDLNNAAGGSTFLAMTPVIILLATRTHLDSTVIIPIILVVAPLLFYSFRFIVKKCVR